MEIKNKCDQVAEIMKCAENFVYFCDNYVKVNNPVEGIVPFELMDFQKRYVQALQDNRFVIGTKFRQGGFTTTTLAYYLWLCMFQRDRRCMVATNRDRGGMECTWAVKLMLDHLPEWMKPNVECTTHQIRFQETGSDFFAHTPHACCGRSQTHLFFDEAAFLKDAEQHWKAMYPVISCGGSVVVMSTPNGEGNWFADTYHEAVAGRNSFYIFKCEYTECKRPPFDSAEGVAELRKNLGEKGFQMEILQKFKFEEETKPEIAKWDFETALKESILKETEIRDPVTKQRIRVIEKSWWLNISEAEERELAKRLDIPLPQNPGKIIADMNDDGSFLFLDPDEACQSTEPGNAWGVPRIRPLLAKGNVELICENDSVFPELKSKLRADWDHELTTLAGVGIGEDEVVCEEFEEDYRLANGRQLEHPRFNDMEAPWTGCAESLGKFCETYDEADAKHYFKFANKQYRRELMREERVDLHVNYDMMRMAGVLAKDEEIPAIDVRKGKRDIIYTLQEDDSLPEMEILFCENRLCINEVPTNITEEAVMSAYYGLASFRDHESAVTEVVAMVRNKLTPLYAEEQ